MAKQKGGLGRGLNALFDEASVHNNAQNINKSDENKENQRKERAQQTEESHAAVQQSQETSSTASSVLAGKPVQHNETKQVSSINANNTASQKDTSNIYFSEDALENAKVVEREVRKTPTLRTTAEQKRKTSELRAEQVRRANEVVPSKKDASKQSDSSQENKPTEPKKEEKGDVGEVDITLVYPNPDQPRTHFKPEEIEELASSIKKEGLLQPILVSKVGDKYQIIAGERRWQACKNLGIKSIPVRLWTADSDKALELALIENIQRSDLNPIEEAYGYKRLMERKGMTQSEVAQTVSKGRSTVANALRLLDLPEEAQQLLFEEKITAGHARAILSIPSAEGKETLTKKLVNEKLSVRETESIARLLAGKEASKTDGAAKRLPTPQSFKVAARSLTKFLSTPVRVKTVKGKNKIEIQFKDEEELNRILQAINRDEEAIA